jgi:hypothetical protein
MWEQENDSDACFRVSGWSLRAQCRPAGLRLITSHDRSGDRTGEISFINRELPTLTESFIRGDELHLSMPQEDGNEAGIDVELLVIQADRDYLIVESTLSLQTLWLDAHPAIRLKLAGDDLITCHSKGTSRVYWGSEQGVASDSLHVSVFVDERDQLSINATGDNSECLQFFGDFMEKGVIRKVQPWWVWTCRPLNDSQIYEIANSLAKRPLPLTS